MNLDKFKGVFPAFYACYDAEGEISEEGIKRLSDDLFEKGVQGVYVGGSSGECVYQSLEERKETLKHVAEHAKDKLTLIAHVGAPSTKDSVALAQYAEELGYDALSAIPPIYYQLPESSIEAYWTAIMESTELPFIIYNIPQTTGYDLSIQLLEKLLANDKLIGVKNSSMPVMDIESSGGHLYHHIHELDFIQFIMGPAKSATMLGGNVAHKGEQYGDEDDLLLISLEFEDHKLATLQYGSAFRWGEHYIKIQGTKGAILLDLQHTKMVLRTEDGDQHFLLHASKEEDDDRTRIYQGLDGGIMYGDPHDSVPLWLKTIMQREMRYFHDCVQGAEIEEEFIPLLDGTAARDSIATADALTLSIKEGRKVSVKEITSRSK